jgi:hypothetical protein
MLKGRPKKDAGGTQPAKASKPNGNCANLGFARSCSLLPTSYARTLKGTHRVRGRWVPADCSSLDFQGSLTMLN